MAHALKRTTSRPLGRAFRAALILGIGLSLFGTAGSRQTIRVEINGVPLAVFDRTSVGEVMNKAGVTVRDGVLYSAGQNKVLDRHFQEPAIRVNGTDADRATQLRGGDRVEAEDGVDTSEKIEVEPIVVPAGLPEVEHRLWNAGQNGIDEVSKGARSGEVVSRVNKLPVIPATPDEQPLVALTFDDGPDPRWTIPILENLSREGIKATFCVVGKQARKFPELIHRMVAEGHTLCDHSETHPAGLKSRSRSEIDLEIGSPSFYLRSLTGVAPGFFRAPGGSINDQVIKSAQSRGMRILAWSVDPSDFRGPPPGEIQQRVMSEVKPGSVILLHDGGGIRSSTVAALPGLITQLREAGYGFRTP